MEFGLIVVIFALASVGAQNQRPLALITAPNIVHLGVEETVTVQLHEATQPASMILLFKNQKSEDILSDTVSVSLNESNHYQAVVRLQVKPNLYRSLRMKSSPPYVQLIAQSESVFQRKSMANILLSFRKGYILIQTDKPIYNPGENANFRVFTLDNYLLPTDEQIEVRILNSKGLMIYSGLVQSKQIYEQNIIIPDVEQAGLWKVIAWFTNLPESNTTVEFEVREYVLPSFEVKIEAPKPYYLLKESHFQFNVTARYTYGKGLNGIAYVRFGIIEKPGNITFLPGIEVQTQIQDGGAQITLLTEDLRERARNRNVWNIEGCYLYIAVTALEAASGELEETESSTVKIVSTPYIIDLSKTKAYFTPGGIFSILATVTYPDGTVAQKLQTKATVTPDAGEGPLSLEGMGNEEGEVVLTFQTPKQATSLAVKVFAGAEMQDIILSESHMTAVAVTMSKSESYLSVEVPHVVLRQKEEITVTFRDITPHSGPRPTHIYYMILSKGQVLQLSRVQRSELTTISLPFSDDLVPSFRLVAYYYILQGDKWDMVADSVWVDVQDVCKGQMEILPFVNDFKPAELVDVKVRTDQAERVALAAVDSAVYILSKQNKLTSQKLFDYMNSYDLACSVGGGKDHSSVFYDAGLTFIRNIGEPAVMRKEFGCSGQRQRHKRAFDHQQQFSAIVNQYKQPEDRKCCNDGARLSRMKLSCEKRLAKTLHRSKGCREIFYSCCNAATKLRLEIQRTKKSHSLARMEQPVEYEDPIDEVSVHLRSYFPQTWMWTSVNVPASGLLTHRVVVPDTITTWEIQAIGFSKTKGFCIAEPRQLKVFQAFFVSLKLPYSVKRNEQLEVKAVLYNYRSQLLMATVEMESVAGLCMAGSADNQQVVEVPGNSVVSVYFTVVPLVIGNIPITVKVYVSTGLADQIMKNLKVVGEGELVSQQIEHNLQANRSRVSKDIDIPVPVNAIPGLESEAYVSVKGGAMGESVENCLNLEGVDRLIVLPTGCAEQTMVKMSPAIHAMKYLDASDQWIYLKAERRDEALDMIRSGYTRILTFKKDDGSYGLFQHTPSSIWLTAFIAKELLQCRSIIAVEDSYIKESISYLVSKQLESGAFNDPNPVYDRNMQGGVGGVEGDVSLTAFVLITMHHSLLLYREGEGTGMRVAMIKAEDYLKDKLDSLKRPFAVAITAYALTLTTPRGEAAVKAQAKLHQMAKCDSVRNTCHWDADQNLRLTGEQKVSQVPQADSISVETSAYALLQTLLSDDRSYALRIARWLTEQRQFGGGFRSTQDTVVALEALSKFSIQENDVRDLDLMVEVCLPRGKKKDFHLKTSTASVLPVFKVTPGTKVTVNVAGRGSGTFSLVQTYRSLDMTGSHCHNYQLNVSLEGEVKYLSPEDSEDGLDDYYNYDAGEEMLSAEEPLSRVEWFDLRTRRKRMAPQSVARENTLVYTVCVRIKGMNSTGMAIVDISLLSGLEPNMQDLEDNVKGTEKYIDHYDRGPNKVYLYFNQVTDHLDCVQFRATQIASVGLVQPANAVIYDYYNPERRCSVFYSAPQRSSMVSKLCQGNVCTCAEGQCPKSRVTFSKDMKKGTRQDYACYSPIVDYIYVVKVIHSREDGVFRYYNVLVTKVLQTSKDQPIKSGAERELVHRKSCHEFSMIINMEYLVMGKEATVAHTTDAKGKFQYLLNRETWIEEIPPQKKCRGTLSRKACHLLESFLEQYELQQCMS